MNKGDLIDKIAKDAQISKVRASLAQHPSQADWAQWRGRFTAIRPPAASIIASILRRGDLHHTEQDQDYNELLTGASLPAAEYTSTR